MNNGMKFWNHVGTGRNSQSEILVTKKTSSGNSARKMTEVSYTDLLACHTSCLVLGVKEKLEKGESFV